MRLTPGDLTFTSGILAGAAGALAGIAFKDFWIGLAVVTGIMAIAAFVTGTMMQLAQDLNNASQTEDLSP